MSRARRNSAPRFTAQVALAAITGDKTLAELAEECDGHPNQISAGKPQVQESAVVVFGGPTHAKKAGGAGPQGAARQDRTAHTGA
jgi:transposase